MNYHFIKKLDAMKRNQSEIKDIKSSIESMSSKIEQSIALKMS